MARRLVDVKVDGTQKVIRTLQHAKVKASDLKDAWARIGAKVRNDAISIAPVLTGRLRRTIRASKSKSRATVRAGNNRIPPYVPIIHYGGYNNIEPHPFLVTALHSNEGYAKEQVQNEIQSIIQQLDLGTFRV